MLHQFRVSILTRKVVLTLANGRNTSGRFFVLSQWLSVHPFSALCISWQVYFFSDFWRLEGIQTKAAVQPLVKKCILFWLQNVLKGKDNGAAELQLSSSLFLFCVLKLFLVDMSLPMSTPFICERMKNNSFVHSSRLHCFNQFI